MLIRERHLHTTKLLYLACLLWSYGVQYPFETPNHILKSPKKKKKKQKKRNDTLMISDIYWEDDGGE